jgi:hypothetical protein
MRSHILAVDLLLSDAILVDTKRCQDSSGPRVDFSTSVADDAHYDLLPRVLAPRLAVCPRVHVLDVLDHTNHCARKQLVLLIVHGDDDEELGVPWLCKQLLAQCEALCIEVSGVAGGGGVSHMRELVTLGGLCMRDLVQQPRWNRAIEHQVALEQLHLLDRLPSLYRRGCGCRRWLIVERVVGMLVEIVLMGVRAIRVCALDHGPPHVIVLPVVVRLRAIWLVRVLVVR